MASLAVPLMLRGPGSEAPGRSAGRPPCPTSRARPAMPRVVMVLLEGASLDLIAPAAAEGRLPNFERLLERGRLDAPGDDAADAAGPGLDRRRHRQAARSRTASGRPPPTRRWPAPRPSRCCPTTASPTRWSSSAFLRERVHTSGDLAARPLWSLLGAQGVPVGVVNWSVTQPARDVRGYLVSDQFERRDDVGGRCREHRRDLAARDAVAGGGDGGERGAPARPGVSAEAARRRRRELIASPCAADQAHEQIAAALDARDPSRFQAVRYECLDAVGPLLPPLCRARGVR